MTSAALPAAFAVFNTAPYWCNLTACQRNAAVSDRGGNGWGLMATSSARLLVANASKCPGRGMCGPRGFVPHHGPSSTNETSFDSDMIAPRKLGQDANDRTPDWRSEIAS